jgi:SSS family transporter
MGNPGWSFRHNLELIWSTCGYPLMAPFFLIVFVPFYANLKLYTAYEYLERRFDVRVRAVTSLLFLLLRCVHISLVIYAPALVINLVTGVSVWKSVLFMGLFTTLYTMLGGMKAVVWTDVIQFCTVVAGVALVFYKAMTSVSGMTEAYRIARDAGRLSIFNFSTDPSELTSFWAGIIGGSVLALAPLATDQAVLQRFFTTRSEKDCRKSVIVQASISVPLAFLLYLTGTALFVFYRLHPERLAGLSMDDAILPFFAVRELPNGVSGLIIAAIFAASMAAMSAGINSMSTCFTMDFYQRLLRPNRDSEHYTTIGRASAVLWGLITTALALFAGRMGFLALAYNRASSIISGPLLGIFLLATLSRRTTGLGALLGAAVGFALVWVTSMQTNWSFFWWGPIGVLGTVFFGYLVSLLTTPPPESKTRGLVVGEVVQREPSSAVREL